MNKISFIPFPELTTERLFLRQLKDEDDNEIFKLRTDVTVLKYLNIAKAEKIDDARKFITRINNGIKNNEWIYWAVTLKSGSRLIGTICLWNISEDQSKADIGFMLIPEYFGKGIMQEAIKPVIEYGFKYMRLDKIEGDVSRDNIKSIKLMEKNNFVFLKKKDDKKDDNVIIYELKNFRA